MSVLADGVTIQVSHFVWSFGLNNVLYVLMAVVVGIIAEAIVGWHVPLGIIGAFIFALGGIWLMTHIIVITGIGDWYLFGVPVFRALAGSIILVALWHALTYGFTRRRYRTA